MSFSKQRSAVTPGRGIESEELTTCEICQDGKTVRLNFRDRAGEPAFLELPFDQAQSIVMTLPGLLSAALQVRTGNPQSRYVFPLERWALELVGVDSFLLLSLRTDDGFEVSFSVAPEICKALGKAMQTGHKTITEGTAAAAAATSTH
jgi:hypothetical protein